MASDREVFCATVNKMWKSKRYCAHFFTFLTYRNEANNSGESDMLKWSAGISDGTQRHRFGSHINGR
jgi:hypothetical protein